MKGSRKLGPLIIGACLSIDQAGPIVLHTLELGFLCKGIVCTCGHV
jgi:hypothetical protein